MTITFKAECMVERERRIKAEDNESLYRQSLETLEEVRKQLVKQLQGSLWVPISQSDMTIFFDAAKALS